MIKVENLNKRYRRGDEVLHVLRDLTMQIETAEFLALMGPSGSGKTTLLNIVAGLDRADSGRVTVQDQDLTVKSDAELTAWRAARIGFIFQFYNLLPVLTALENVMLPLSLLDMPQSERKRRAVFALEVVGLQDRLNHFPRQLSGGQEQRVAIARAIVTDPLLIVADEPTGDLDRGSAGEILKLLQRLNGEFNKTIVMVTHDPAAAEHASRTVHLDKGRLQLQ